MAEAHWYVVHTYSGYENKVKANIDKTIENRHLEDQILEVRVPMQDVVELKNGANKTVSKKMFPGYVLINMVMNDDTWYVVRNTRGVTGFVGPGSKPVPLTDMEMRPLGIKTENIEVDFAESVESERKENYFASWSAYFHCIHMPSATPPHLKWIIEIWKNRTAGECLREGIGSSPFLPGNIGHSGHYSAFSKRIHFRIHCGIP